MDKFGPNATFELNKPNRLGSNPRNVTQDWNAVIRGMDPEIDLVDFNQELEDHHIKFRKTVRITTANGDKTHMIRIYFEDQESVSKAIFNGITILGRRYRVEPPRLEARHIPCKKCAQYGHTSTLCKNNPICFQCGKMPGACSHNVRDNIMFCATCRSHDHYTGQVRCRLYPRSEAPPENQRPRPLPRQIQTSPLRPSTMDFPPPLHQNAWTKNPFTQNQTISDNVTQNPELNSNRQDTDTAENNLENMTVTDRLEVKIVEATNKVIKESMEILEKYIDTKINNAIDQIIKYTMTVINNVVRPIQTQELLTTSNNTVKKLWQKRVQMLLIGKHVDIIIDNMTGNLKENLRQMTAEAMTNNPPPPTPLQTPWMRK